MLILILSIPSFLIGMFTAVYTYKKEFRPIEKVFLYAVAISLVLTSIAVLYRSIDSDSSWVVGGIIVLKVVLLLVALAVGVIILLKHTRNKQN